MKTKIFYTSITGFFVGVTVGLVEVPMLPAAGMLLLLVLAAVTLRFVATYKESAFHTILVVALLTMALGLVRTSLDIGNANETVFDSAVGEEIEAVGTIANRPAVTEYGQNFTVRLSGMQIKNSKERLEGVSKAVVYAPAFPQLQYGDRIRLVGELRTPSSFETDTGRRFNYPDFLARNEVFYEMSQPQISLLQHGKGNFLKQQLTYLQERLLSSIHAYVPDPHAALTGGVLLGAEDALGEKLQSNFRDTGLIHIVVLSGYNVTIVAAAVGAAAVFLGLSLSLAIGVSIFAIILFALLVGLTPTVVRASIMAVIALVARVSGRQYAASRGLAAAAFLMVVVNPHILLFDPSFQLSAVATAGLISWGESINEKMSFIPRVAGIREAVTATVSAQLAVTPLLLFYTGNVSIVSLLANLLVLPVVPSLMAAGAGVALTGMISEVITLPFTAVAYAVSDYIFAVVNWLASLPFAVVTGPDLSVWAVCGVYGAILAGVWWKYTPYIPHLPPPTTNT